MAAVLLDLKNFTFAELLNNDAARKVVFLRLKSQIDGADAVVICDKLPFVENANAIGEWLGSSSLHHQLTNANFHSYIMDLPPEHNGWLLVDDVKKTGKDAVAGTKMTLIHPAAERDIEKYRRKETFLLSETPIDFAELTIPYIDSIKSNLQWVYNFLEGKAESERVVFKDPDPINGFLLAPDLKWAGKDVDNLYLTAVVNRRDLRSVRDLTANELPLLEGIRDKSAAVIAETYGLKSNQLLMYFHYQPTFFHLHVHIVNLKYEAPGLNITCIPLNEVIDNLKLYPDYYSRATLQFYRRPDPLFEQFQQAGRV